MSLKRWYMRMTVTLRQAEKCPVGGQKVEVQSDLELQTYKFTLPKANMDPENGTLKDCFPLQTSGFQGPC